MEKRYGLTLPQWGPYNKKYLGASHTAHRERGLRFDVNLFPGYYRRNVMIPRDAVDCGAKMMAASRDVSHYRYRYELEWKDRVYIDADFTSRHHTMTVACHFVNSGDDPESLSLNALFSMSGCTAYKRELKNAFSQLPEGCVWVNAIDYRDIRCQCQIASDGLYKGEQLVSGFVESSGLSREQFGREGTWASYSLPFMPVSTVGIRYRGGGSLTLKTNVGSYRIKLPQTEEIDYYVAEIEKQTISWFSVLPHDAKLDLDGFVLGEEAQLARFSYEEQQFIPVVTQMDDALILNFGGLEYTVRTDWNHYVVRQLTSDDVGTLLTNSIHNHVDRVLTDGDGQKYVDLFLRPVFMPPRSSRTITLTITAPEGRDAIQPDHTLYTPVCTADGEAYRLSQTIMGAVTLTNVVWPIYCRRGYIHHNTPGRQWDSLYTWDSGFIGMGLAALDIGRAKDCLNAYLTPVDDPHSPCIFHGTPLPTQILLFAELFNLTGDRDFVAKYYPLVKQQYDFFSRAERKKTGLFNLWHLFYNSGGWDDYPAQVYMHNSGLAAQTCPAIPAAMTVLCARVLLPFADMLGQDTTQFREDIHTLSQALNRYSWDESAGYYSYVVHGRQPEQMQLMGTNANMGMDGAFPYLAGISDPAQSRRILANIKEGMMTPIGVSVVDTRAPYYRKDGYWNGSVWMPHQWLLWKGLLDNGESGLAFTIAKTALDVWEKEVAATYNCYEHFMLENGRGAGVHQFSGLSTPVLMWFHAYYMPYAVTGGFFTLITDRKVTDDGLSFRVSAVGTAPAVLVCLEDAHPYIFQTAARVEPLTGTAYALLYDGPVQEQVTIYKSR